MIPRPTSSFGAVVEIAVIVVVAIGLALGIQAVAVKPYRIPSGSMQPTLDIGQRVLVNRLSHHLGSDPEIGDVVVFHPPVSGEEGHTGPSCTVPHEREQVCPMNEPNESDQAFIKRVVAGPGDTLEVDQGIPIVNGEPVEGDWTIRPCGQLGTGCNFRDPITIPPDHYFMMGDNRGSSDDSRFWGPVPRDWIVGQAFATYWPLDRLGLL